ADRSFRRALELNPSYATGRQWYALALALQGSAAESLDQIARARELDVLSPAVNFSVAWMHYFARDYGKARESCERALEINPEFPVSHLLLAGVHTFRGHPEDALREHDVYDRLTGGTTVGHLFRACHQARAGDPGPLRLAL